MILPFHENARKDNIRSEKEQWRSFNKEKKNGLEN